MAERKGTRRRATAAPATASRGKRKEVIDVDDDDKSRAARGDGDDEDEEKDEDEDGEGDGDGDGDEKGSDDVDDDFLATAAEVIDVSDGDPAEGGDLEPKLPAKRADNRGGSLAKRDPLAAYMSETRRYPLLTPEQERTLATALFEKGDTVAARKLVEANLRLVVKIAYEYRRAHRNLLDLIQEGNIGLMQAVGKFDPYRGVKLSSYAAFWIRAYILKFILNNWRLVKIGTTQAQRKLFFNLRKEKEKLEQLGFQPTAQLLAERLDVSEKDVVEMEKRLSAPEASLDAPLSSDDDGSRTRLDTLPSDDVRPDVAVEQSEFSELLKSKLETFAGTLEGRDQTIFRERWLTDAPLTLQEIGDRYGVSRERARQLEKRLLGKLRKFLEEELGSAVDIDAMTRE
jgi:RNA polymerase sigma-32 factor